MARSANESVVPGAARRRLAAAAPVSVWCVWLALLAAGLAYVLQFGSSVPYQDEWEMVPYATGQEKVTAGWLWQQHNEHRLPLPKLIYLALAAATRSDSRAGMVFNLLTLAATAAGLILLMRRLRGRTAWSDVFFPLLLLSWGHCENLTWGFQIGFVLPSCIACGILAAMTRTDRGVSWPNALALGILTLLLPLCGANGVAYVPALSVWMAYAALAQREERHGQLPRALLGLFSLAGFALVALYFVGFRRCSHHPPSPGVGASLLGALRFLGTSFGLIGRRAWPFFTPLSALFAAAGAVRLGHVWLRQPQERLRAAGLLMGLGGILSLALGIGWGRSGFGPANPAHARYVTLAMPLLCWAFLVAFLYSPDRWRRLLAPVFALGMLLIFLYDLRAGRAVAVGRRKKIRSFEEELRAGTYSLEELAERHTPAICPHAPTLAARLEMLRAARLGPFRSRD